MPSQDDPLRVGLDSNDSNNSHNSGNSSTNVGGNGNSRRGPRDGTPEPGQRRLSSSSQENNRGNRSNHSGRNHNNENHGNHNESHKPLRSYKIFLSLGLFILALYLIIMGLFMHSIYLQSFVAYMHLVDLPFEHLENLFMYGLSNARNVKITTSDGLKLGAWHILPPGDVSINSLHAEDLNEFYDRQIASAKRVFIYCHGNSASRGFPYRVNFIKHLSSQFDAHVIAFDYRGFADSEGNPTEHGTLLDTRAVVEWISNITLKHGPSNAFGYLPGTASAEAFASQTCSSSGSEEQPQSHFPQPHLFMYGHSLGTAISVAQAVDMEAPRGSGLPPSRLSGVILDCPFTDLAEASMSHPAAAAFRVLPFIKNKLRTMLQIRYPTIERIGNVTVPILIMHGEKDNKIPPDHSEKLFDVITKKRLEIINAQVDKQSEDYKGDLSTSELQRHQNYDFAEVKHFPIPDADHGNVFHSPIWLRELAQFIKSAEKWTHKRLLGHHCQSKSSN